jgi:hypothetical protein
MNGSNLESKNEFASKNIRAMLSAMPEKENINIVILTGGAKKWHSHNISEDSITYSVINSKGFKKLSVQKNESIADSIVLANFIDYGISYFAAERYSLIFWNHGTGSVTGFGYDELFDKKTMSIAELQSGIRNGLKNKKAKFSFIGFDACLMSSIELAISLSPFADYLIASQELEPGDGWDYSALLKTLNERPGIGTDSLCIRIIDSYINLYKEKEKSLEKVTLSAISLQKTKKLEKSLNQISQKALLKIPQDSLAMIRKRSAIFGQPVFSAYSYDMVDARSLFEGFSAYFPQEWREFDNALKDAVLYNRLIGLDYAKTCGLSIYFPYDNKRTIANLGEYCRLENMGGYIGLIKGFIDNVLTKKAEIIITDSANFLSSDILLKTKKIYSMLLRREKDGKLTLLGYDSDGISFKNGKIIWNKKWIQIGGNFVCVYEKLSDIDALHYAVPALVNNEKSYLILTYDDSNPSGAIYGVRKEIDDYVPSKGYEKIKSGDSIAFLYPFFDKNTMQESDGFARGQIFAAIYKKDVKVNIAEVSEPEYIQIFCLVDIYGNMHYIGREKIFNQGGQL